MKNPSFTPNSKYVENSKILQLAYLDKIIEECDEDQDANQIKGVIDKTKKFMVDQEEKIKIDKLKVDMSINKEGDFEYQIKFDKSFYGMQHCNALNQDRFDMRNQIVETLGKKGAKKGISDKSDLFWISKKKPFSKEFAKKYPNLVISVNSVKDY